MSTVNRTQSSVIHQVAGCQVCHEHWEHYKTAGGKARAHTLKTGHTTYVETGTAYNYEAQA